jgi:XTP/dITP diphosphohydrolase
VNGTPPRRLVLASGSSGKLRELRELLRPLAVDVLPQSDLAVSAAAEPHPSFLENALAKARHAAAATGLPALADDSGLCCDALGGAPGVRSARFAGDEAGGSDDASNNAALVARLRGHDNRAGHYVCVLVALRSPDDPEPLVAEGRWHGRIVAEPLGANGFGYDPHFWIDELGATVAQLEPRRKNELSHRAAAMRILLQAMRARWYG